MRRQKLNNQGSTLLTVIILLVFLSILGTMMLSVTMTNLQMKAIDRKSKENFYSCEITLDEIRAGLYELTVEKARNIYENDILANITNHITKTESEMNTYLKDKIALALIRELGDPEELIYLEDKELLDEGESVKPKSNNMFNMYLTLPPEDGDILLDIDIEDINIISGTEIVDGTTKIKRKIRVRDVYVTLTINELESRIKTDIIVDLPDFSFENGLEEAVYQLVHPYKDYALIADGKIISDNTIGSGATPTNSIYGSVYSGGGIMVGSDFTEYHKVKIQGENILTRGNVDVTDGGELAIKGITKEDPDTGLPVNVPAVVWADNLVTNSSDSIRLGSNSTTLNIDGICLVKDDLTLNAPNSNVSLNGAYVGYTSTRSSLGSSMIINGNNSSLDLSGLDSLILAGRAHVSVDDVIDDTGGRLTDILTGESIAIKSNQKAYLIPGRFIKGINSEGDLVEINHNPITEKDIEEYGIPMVDFTDLDSMNDIRYTDYVDSINPFKLASKQTVSAEETNRSLRYYYLAFKSGKDADDYLQRYTEFMIYQGIDNVLDNMNPFTIKNLTLPDNTKEKMVAGNMTSYDSEAFPMVNIDQGISAYSSDEEEVNNIINSYPLGYAPYNNSSLKDENNAAIYTVSNLNSLYDKISHTLTLESNRAYKFGEEVVESTVIPSGGDFLEDWLHVSGNIYPLVEFYGSSMDFYEDKKDGHIIIVNGNVTLYNDFAGFMIVYGDNEEDNYNVTIADGVTVEGMIVAMDRNIDAAADNSQVDDTIGPGSIRVGNNVNVTGKLVAMGDINLGSNCVITSSEDSTNGFFEDQGTILRYIFRNLDQTTQYTTADADNLVDLSSMVYYSNWRRQ